MPSKNKRSASLSLQTQLLHFHALEEFKYLGTTLTNQNSIAEEIKSLMSGNACYHLVQNLLSLGCYLKI